MQHYCTYFDSNYLIQGLTLYRSLVRCAAPFRLWVLCFDRPAFDALNALALPEVVPIALEDFEAGDTELLQAKRDRTRVEYYFTCTPSLPLFVLRSDPDARMVTYLDADMFFYSKAAPLHAELGDGSVLIVGHRYPSWLDLSAEHGIYNVSFLVFRRDARGLACLQWWRERCLEWCYDRLEDGKFADQKYLDDWPERFAGVRVLEHKGGGLAPWNVAAYALDLSGGSVLVDGQPLVYYHFHAFRRLTDWLYDANLSRWGVRPSSVLRRLVYRPYLRALCEVRQWTAAQLGDQGERYRMGTVRGGIGFDPSTFSGGIGGFVRSAREGVRLAKRGLLGDLFVAADGRL